MSKGKQPRPSVKVPKYSLSGKRCGNTQTARRLAWKQPSFKESVTAHWSSVSALKNSRGSNESPKLWLVYFSIQG